MLDDVSIEVATGELVVLTGEDGCGTTSLLRVVPGTLLEAPPGTGWAASDVVAASAALSALGGDHLVGRTLEKMSNGERQRVRVASVAGADVLLLDDGLGFLDTAGVLKVLALLRDNLECLCRHHHRAKHAIFTVLADPDGTIIWITRGDWVFRRRPQGH